MLNKQLAFAVRFARFTEEERIHYGALAKLCELRDKIAKVEFKGCNVQLSKAQEDRADAMRSEFTAIAKAHGFGVDFGNPYPCLMRGTAHLQLP